MVFSTDQHEGARQGCGALPRLVALTNRQQQARQRQQRLGERIHGGAVEAHLHPGGGGNSPGVLDESVRKIQHGACLMLARHLTGGDGADRVVLRCDGALADRNHVRGIFGAEGADKLDEPLGKSASRKSARAFSLLLSLPLSPRLPHRPQRRLSILTCGDGMQQRRGGQGERVEQQAQTGIGPGGTPRQGDSVTGACTGA